MEDMVQCSCPSAHVVLASRLPPVAISLPRYGMNLQYQGTQNQTDPSSVEAEFTFERKKTSLRTNDSHLL
jgi:hypothetical protein